MNVTTSRCRVGDLRPSQLIYTFGVGAVVDLPAISAIVMGLDDWDLGHVKEIAEERLLAAVREELGPQVERLCTPPLIPEDETGPVGPLDPASLIGVPVAPFPRWLRCPYCHLLAPVGSGLFQLRADRYRPDRTRYVHHACSKPGHPPTVVPSRFLVACKHGHLDDFPWVDYVHYGAANCDAPVIRIFEFGVSGEAADIEVRCDACGQKRRLADAFGENSRKVLPDCRGRRPHLRDYEEGGCSDTQRTITLGASNSWFPITIAALSIPQSTNRLDQLVSEHWPTLERLEGVQNVGLLRGLGMLRAFAAYDDEELWRAIEARRLGESLKPQVGADLKTPEWLVFSSPGTLQSGPDFSLTPVDPPERFRPFLSQVVLVERIREVRALLGFARIESPGDFGEQPEVPPEQRAPLSRRAPSWVPAAEVRGEGIFLRLDEDAVETWCRRVEALDREFLEAHRQWRTVRRLPDPNAGFPGVRYLLLHSLSHALMRQFCLECGYSAASIRERIYSRSPEEDGGPMAGILLYTSAPDSEGTLGGLVELGKPGQLARHLQQALLQLEFCASDPLCAEHHPYRDGVTLHSAACHACLFAPETSCERGNRFLDRAVLVETFAGRGLAFFTGTETVP